MTPTERTTILEHYAFEHKGVPATCDECAAETPQLVEGQMLDEYGNGLTNLDGKTPLLSPGFLDEREAFCDSCKEYHNDENRDHKVVWLG